MAWQDIDGERRNAETVFGLLGADSKYIRRTRLEAKGRAAVHPVSERRFAVAEAKPREERHQFQAPTRTPFENPAHGAAGDPAGIR